jgi:acyl dehydratase
MTLAYAAGIAAIDDCYLDDARPDGVMAPPPFCVALEWPVVNGEAFRTAIGVRAEDRVNAVHVTQDSHFHRPIRPGDALRTTGRVIGMRSTAAGTLIESRLDTAESKSGAAVVTSFHAAIYRRMSMSGSPARSEAPPALRHEPDLPAGAATSATLPVARGLPHIYTECAAIWNPIHTERRIALAARLPDIILHGTATWALAAQHLIGACAGGDLTRLRRFGGRFKAMVIPGTSIRVEHASDPDRPGRVGFVVRNAAGELAIAHGIAEFDD